MATTLDTTVNGMKLADSPMSPSIGPGTALLGKTLVSKLAEVMSAVAFVPKRGHNTFHGYDYATEADIVAAIRMELAQRSIVLLPGVSKWTREPVGEKGSVLTHLDMTFTFFDGETGEELTRPWLGAGTDKEDKGAYKAMTGGEKYFLLKTFLMPTGDDPEQETKQERGGRQRRQGRRDMAARDGVQNDTSVGNEGTSAARASGSTDHAFIDGDQQRQLIDAAKRAGWTKDVLQAYVRHTYGAWSRMPAVDFHAVLAQLSQPPEALATHGDRQQMASSEVRP
jgi:hypothetical protein